MGLTAPTPPRKERMTCRDCANSQCWWAWRCWVTLAVVVPITIANAATCAAAWSSSAVYTGGMMASYQTHNWRAKWWTQNETPGGASGVWEDQGACGGGGGGGGGGGHPAPGGFVVSESQFNQM